MIYRVNQAKDDMDTFILFEEVRLMLLYWRPLPSMIAHTRDHLQYKDEAAFETHKAGEGFQALSAKAGEWLAEPLLIRSLQACQL